MSTSKMGLFLRLTHIRPVFIHFPAILPVFPTVLHLNRLLHHRPTASPGRNRHFSTELVPRRVHLVLFVDKFPRFLLGSTRVNTPILREPLGVLLAMRKPIYRLFELELEDLLHVAEIRQIDLEVEG